MRIDITNEELIDLLDTIDAEKEILGEEIESSKALIEDLLDEVKDLKSELNAEKIKIEQLSKLQMVNGGLPCPAVQFSILKKLLDVCINSEVNPKTRRIPMIKLIRDLTQCNVRVARDFVDQFYGKYTGQIIVQEVKQLPLSISKDIEEVVPMPIIIQPSNQN